MMVIELNKILEDLLALPGETEFVEFKEAKEQFDFRKIGKYFSALSNEANLAGKDFAWLVFGVDDNRNVVGSQFRSNRVDLDSLKGEISKQTNNGITFTEIHELNLPEGRVVLFQIPSAPKGIPIAFQGHWYGRNGEELCALNIDKIERIRRQLITVDWSAKIIDEASIEDLDPVAIALARKNYKNKFPDKADELESWDDITFLNKAKVTKKGEITRTAIILLGRDEAEHFISPAVAKLRWILKNSKGEPRDYAIFSCPLILAVDKVFAKIRNIKYRYLPEGTLFPEEVDQYEPFTIREAINNCIAHQDYTKGGMINVVEMEDQLLFTNLGSFIPGSVEKVIEQNSPEEYYRNAFLARAMFNLNMVDTIGSGILKIFNFQRDRFFPMPDYDFSNGKVKMLVTGKVLDKKYADILAKNTDLSLLEVILLDKVQKKQKISDESVKMLRRKKLIEGRKPNYFLAKKIADETGQKANYSKAKAFDKQYYMDLIVKSIKEHGFLERKDIDELLWDKLSDAMNDKQKKIKVANILNEMKREHLIENIGSRATPKWIIKSSEI